MRDWGCNPDGGGRECPCQQLNPRPVMGSSFMVEQGLISVWLEDHPGWNRDQKWECIGKRSKIFSGQRASSVLVCVLFVNCLELFLLAAKEEVEPILAPWERTVE